MSTFPELLEKYLSDLMATCPPGYEFDTIDLYERGDNAASVTVWWKPVASPPGD